MVRGLRHAIVLGLVLCLLSLSGIATAQSVAHVTHHSHHQAATHATALCSWLCTAGQGLFSFQVVLAVGSQALWSVPLPSGPFSPCASPVFFQPRAPPRASV